MEIEYHKKSLEDLKREAEAVRHQIADAQERLAKLADRLFYLKLEIEEKERVK